MAVFPPPFAFMCSFPVSGCVRGRGDQFLLPFPISSSSSGWITLVSPLLRCHTVPSDMVNIIELKLFPLRILSLLAFSVFCHKLFGIVLLSEIGSQLMLLLFSSSVFRFSGVSLLSSLTHRKTVTFISRPHQLTCLPSHFIV